ncbi:hypothetical protein I204_00602 [Kwoniella mangroviensis CBS 8886]|nr:uncharacterized protein I203_07150 [Kwoniella mangroviensis CBS 8507]OCF63829.1 hypothetical protein I203_07150 [Kwoniella mangroviensis CBS 8507]OCF78660.1 hypothetical protein I204_00602 [Kwoniella mangroviensis CBS 8886]
MTTHSVGNNDEEYNVTPVLIHPDGQPKRLVTHFTPAYRERGSEEPYQPIIHDLFPIFDLDSGAKQISEEEDLPVKSAMLLKGKDLFTENFVKETSKYVQRYREAKSICDNLRTELERELTALRRDQAKRDLSVIRQSGNLETHDSATGMSQDLYDREAALDAKMNSWYRAKAGLEMIAQGFSSAVEANWNSIQPREIRSETQFIDHISSMANEGSPADLAIRDAWGCYIKASAYFTRANSYVRLNQLEDKMNECSTVVGKQRKNNMLECLGESQGRLFLARDSKRGARDDFLNGFHSRYGWEVEVPDSGSKWNALWSQHQEKMIRKTNVRYELGTSDGTGTRPAGRIVAEYILGDEDEQRWRPIAHPNVPSFNELTKQDSGTDRPPGKRLNARNFLSKEMNRKVLPLATAMTQISEARSALKDDEQGLAELKRVEIACKEIKNTLPEAITSNMQALYDREVSQWNKSFRDSEMIAQRVIPYQGEIISRWMDRVQTSLWHHDCLERARLTSLTAHLRADTDQSPAALDVQHKLEEELDKLNGENQRFLIDFDETFGPETRIPITGEEWQRLCTKFPAASGGAETVFDANQASDYSSYTRRNTASGPQGFCKIPHKYLVLWGKT